MEEKIYERQVTKHAVSSLVIDEKEVHRYYTREEITELYTFKRKAPLSDKALESSTTVSGVS